MPRFVLLRHDCPADYRDGPHWDLMLERAERDDERRLATWSLATLPHAWGVALGVNDVAQGAEVLATRLDDHRAAYLDYEGPLSGNRGEVRRCAGGEIAWLRSTQAECAVELLEPGALCGILTLTLVVDGWRVGWRAKEAAA